MKCTSEEALPILDGDMDAHAIRDELERLARSDQLARSKRLLRFLRFTVERVLGGDGKTLSESVIGREVYDRPGDYDPVTDGIVRTEVHRLRAKLREYYENAGRQDPVMIEYPAGSYVPVFHRGASEFLPATGKTADAIRSCDWRTSGLGPMANWPGPLKVALSIHLRAKFAAAVCWGPDFILIFNDAMHALLGEQATNWLGRPLAEVQAAHWSRLGPILENVRDQRESIFRESILWFCEQPGRGREAYFTVSLSPIMVSDNEAGGVLIMAIETTEAMLSARRQKTLITLSAAGSQASTEEEASREAIRLLETNTYDIPFACLYVLDATRSHAFFRTSVGVEPGTRITPETIPLSDEGGPLARAISSGRPELLEIGSHLGPLPSGGWDIAPRELAVLPLRSIKRLEPVGVLLAGVNPHLPMDAEYRAFFEAVARELSTVILRARAIERDRIRLAETERQKRSWATLLDYASEEFRSRLAVVLGLLDQSLDEGDIAGSLRSKLLVTRRNALSLVNLVSGLTDLIGAQSGRMQPAYTSLDLGMATDESARAFASMLTRAGLRFVIDCPLLGEPAYVDRSMWEKLILSLLLNAVQFTRSGEIGISVRKTGPSIDTVVWDTGAGIPESELDKIFEPFRSAWNGPGQTGIRLALVRELAALHGGVVTVESKVDKGSKFVVSIPRGSSHLRPDRIVEAGDIGANSTNLRAYVEDALRWMPEQDLNDHRPASHAKRGVDSDWRRRELVPGRRWRILVAESDHDLRRYLESITSNVYFVEVVSDGHSALSVLRDQPVDLLLADAELRGIDGLSLVRSVRADPLLGSVPIVLMSAHSSQEHRLRAFGAGANDYLVKPFTAPELLVHLESQIALIEYHRRTGERNGGDKAAGVLLRAVLDQLPIGVVLVDPLSRDVVKNRRIYELFGRFAHAITRFDEIPDPFGSRFDGTPIRRSECPLVRAAECGESVTNEAIYYSLPDLEPFCAHVSAFPIRAAQDVFKGAVATYRTLRD
jgi:signal transduction histidine kinase/DNA-binding response OmpR family regulator